MVLVRVWRRQVLRGMGAAALVPVMLIASLAVLALAGGFGGLTALGQAFSGPAAPTAAITSGHGLHAVRPLSPAVVAALSVVPAPRGQGIAARSSSAGGGTGSASHGTAPGSPPGMSHHGSGSPTQSPPSGRPVSASRPGPAPQPQPTLIDGIVGAGTSVSSQVPAPAGPAATNALQAAGSTLDSIAPVKGP
jgi:hypothetical protein